MSVVSWLRNKIPFHYSPDFALGLGLTLFNPGIIYFLECIEIKKDRTNEFKIDLMLKLLTSLTNCKFS